MNANENIQAENTLPFVHDVAEIMREAWAIAIRRAKIHIEFGQRDGTIPQKLHYDNKFLRSIVVTHKFLSVALASAWERSRDRIAYAIRQENAAKEKAAKKAEIKNAIKSCGRVIALYETAHAAGLNHGKTWICGERDIEMKGACPSYEGMEICYVYGN